jgi:integrase
MSVKKRPTKRGCVYVARWRDKDGAQREKTFSRQGDAKEYLAQITTKQIGGSRQTLDWLVKVFLAEQLTRVESQTLEQTTYDNYEGQLRLHVQTDEITKIKCGELDSPAVRALLNRLQSKIGVKYALKIKVLLGILLQWGVNAGHLVHNPARGVRLTARVRAPVTDEDFDALEIELKIPTPAQVRDILRVADARKPKDEGRAGAQLRLLFLGGLRPSEMLGVPVRLIALAPSGRVTIKIGQRISKHGEIGRVKSKKSRRQISLAKQPSLWIREYMLAAGLKKDSLLFPTKTGGAELYTNFRSRVWAPILGEAGFAEQTAGKRKYWVRKNKSERRKGESTVARVETRTQTYWRPFFSPHAGRHFAASALIAANCSPKRLQNFLGHERIELTMNVYGHLFPDQQAEEDLADAIESQVRRSG